MSDPLVTVLGTGAMGAGMVRSLRRAGLPVRMWNRNPAKARALTDTGAEAFEDAAEAAAGADVVLTMVFDADAVIDVIREARPAPGTTWVQSSTVGIQGAARTAEVAGELGLVLVDAPVLGTRQPAEEGALVVLASGPDDVRDRLTPVFDAIGSKTLWLGAAGDGSRLKLACNAYLVMVTAGAAQSVALTRELGLAPEDFLAALEGGPLDSPYLRLKAANMIKGEHPASFGLTNATKDARLILDALRTAHVADRLDVAVVRTMEAAIGRLPDPEAADVSAVIEGLVPDQV